VTPTPVYARACYLGVIRGVGQGAAPLPTQKNTLHLPCHTSVFKLCSGASVSWSLNCIFGKNDCDGYGITASAFEVANFLSLWPTQSDAKLERYSSMRILT
jgi:hypothetical protein